MLSNTTHQNGSNGVTSGHKEMDIPPLIPHVSTNIISLLNVLRFHTQEAFKLLNKLVEKLANTKATSSDISRKLALLDLIVSMRHDFIKIYTLVKWAQRSKDVSKLIDLLNWLRSQDFYFDSLSQGINELNHFSGAKLPNSDIPMALEVLVKGRPQLPSYNYIEKPPISPHTILRVLRELNLTLMARMALVDKMPARFHNSYVVKDGRIIITIPGEFQVSITVGNDLIIDDPEDYSKSPFYFIDFAFLFGINPETALITHKDSNIVTDLPKSSREKLETVVNQVLLNLSLEGLYDVLHKYSISFKLYLISRQLKDLAINGKWRGNFQFKYSSSLIIINYWNNHYLSRGWKSFIEIGFDKKYNLNFRWFKNGKYELDHDIPDINGPSSDTEDAEDLSIDSILTTIVHKHSEKIMAKIHRQFANTISADAISFINPHQLLLELTPRKNTILAINPLTGFLYFMDPTPIMSLYQTKLNSVPTTVENKSFITEQDMIKHIVEILILIRLEMANSFLRTKLITTEWIANDFVKINEHETNRLIHVAGLRSGLAYKILFYRCRNWPSGWFLIYLITGHCSKVYWWVARTKSIQGEWKLQWVKLLDTEDNVKLDYQFLNTLSTSCSNLIIHHLITEELEQRNVGYMRVENNIALKTFNIPVDVSKKLFETVIALHNSGNLLPLSATSTTIFLVVKLFAVGTTTKLKLTMFGSIKGQKNLDSFSFPQLDLKLHKETNLFELLSSISLNNNSEESNESSSAHELLTLLFNSLLRIGCLLRTLDSLNASGYNILEYDLTHISFTIHSFYKPFTIEFGDPFKNNYSRIVSSEYEDPNVKLLLNVMNKKISHNESQVTGCFKYLEKCVSIFQAAKAVTDTLTTKDMRLQNNLKRLNFDFKFQSLNKVQFVFNVNSVHPLSAKKVEKDRIVFSISFVRNKFDTCRKILFRFSMTDSISPENLKFRKLFEHIYRGTKELQQKCREAKEVFVKLNHDTLIEGEGLILLMQRVTESFIVFLGSENQRTTSI